MLLALARSGSGGHVLLGQAGRTLAAVSLRWASAKAGAVHGQLQVQVGVLGSHSWPNASMPALQRASGKQCGGGKREHHGRWAPGSASGMGQGRGRAGVSHPRAPKHPPPIPFDAAGAPRWAQRWHHLAVPLQHPLPPPPPPTLPPPPPLECAARAPGWAKRRHLLAVTHASRRPERHRPPIPAGAEGVPAGGVFVPGLALPCGVLGGSEEWLEVRGWCGTGQPAWHKAHSPWPVGFGRMPSLLETGGR